ncbi:hypothetical protein GGS23DRAFT_290604 [Durotheca rogersii]|uniref:uncharacterized protein n=1 Tax=Durotheca rogersii TaxID=419775 RepID=UPI00221E676F|nr:uncharacterized protein GGS23DRAFT_290604 [Durotheca rogersii]KAI5866816.1 hypothetical protein GGS23DRAFT_290604 [Durotheca rogersii]
MAFDTTAKFDDCANGTFQWSLAMFSSTFSEVAILDSEFWGFLRDIDAAGSYGTSPQAARDQRQQSPRGVDILSAEYATEDCGTGPGLVTSELDYHHYAGAQPTSGLNERHPQFVGPLVANGDPGANVGDPISLAGDGLMPMTIPATSRALLAPATTTAGVAKKHERSRERNRAAAHKCRQKARQSATKLQARERALGLENRALRARAGSLRDDVLRLKSEILNHGTCSSDLIQAYIVRAAGAVR